VGWRLLFTVADWSEMFFIPNCGVPYS